MKRTASKSTYAENTTKTDQEPYITVLGDYPPSMVNAVHELIDRQPTVRDTEKAAEELKDLKLAYYLTIANTGDERLDAIYKNVGDTLDRAIEIINRNGV